MFLTAVSLAVAAIPEALPAVVTISLAVAAREAGYEKQGQEKEYPRVAEIPFDSGRKCMTTLHRDPAGGVLSYTKGAVEVILELSRDVTTSSGIAEIDRPNLVAGSECMAADGLRVLAIGVRHWSTLPDDVTPEAVERDLTLLGLVGLMDPPVRKPATPSTCARAPASSR